MTKLKDLTLHPQFPHVIWVVVEQPRDEPFRLAFDPITETFHRKPHKALTHARGFLGAYGWIGGSGLPPGPHLDAILLTKQNPQPGDVLAGMVCGVFFRQDGDHKIVAVDEAWASGLSRPDLSYLEQGDYHNLTSLYPRVGEHEGWFGADTACAYLLSLNLPSLTTPAPRLP